MTVDLSGRPYVTEAARDLEPAGCHGKHWIPGYLVLGETCGYCDWTKTPISRSAEVYAQLQRWERIVADRARFLEEAQSALDHWQAEQRKLAR